MMHREPKFSSKEKWRMLRFIGFHRIEAEIPLPDGKWRHRGFWTHDKYAGHFSTKEAIKLVQGKKATETKVRHPKQFIKYTYPHDLLNLLKTMKRIVNLNVNK